MSDQAQMFQPSSEPVDHRPLASVHPLSEAVAGHGRVRMVVVNDQEIVQWAMRSLFGAEPWVARCIAARTCGEGLALSHRYEPHVVLVAPLVRGDSGLDLCRRLRQLSPAPRVLLMGGTHPVEEEDARRAGAAGIVRSDWKIAELSLAVRMIASGHELGAPRDTVGLSAREREVMAEVCTGATNNEIARRLKLSPHTIKDHISSIYRKLGVRNRAEAVERSQTLGLSNSAP
jgi:DNA-binding NarL/FixJ family response regulator